MTRLNYFLRSLGIQIQSVLLFIYSLIYYKKKGVQFGNPKNADLKHFSLPGLALRACNAIGEFQEEKFARLSERLQIKICRRAVAPSCKLDFSSCRSHHEDGIDEMPSKVPIASASWSVALALYYVYLATRNRIVPD